MKLKVLALTLTISLVTAAGAMAATTKLTGKVKGDKKARVSLKVVVSKKDGVTGPTRVKGLKFSKLKYTCEDGTTGRKTVKFGSTVVGLVGFPKPFYLFNINKTVKGVQLDGSGKLNKSGTRVKGSFGFVFTQKRADGSGDQTCGRSAASFSAKRKR